MSDNWIPLVPEDPRFFRTVISHPPKSREIVATRRPSPEPLR
jgi:hypothetical protein